MVSLWVVNGYLLKHMHFIKIFFTTRTVCALQQPHREPLLSSLTPTRHKQKMTFAQQLRGRLLWPGRVWGSRPATPGCTVSDKSGLIPASKVVLESNRITMVTTLVMMLPVYSERAWLRKYSSQFNVLCSSCFGLGTKQWKRSELPSVNTGRNSSYRIIF